MRKKASKRKSSRGLHVQRRQVAGREPNSGKVSVLPSEWVEDAVMIPRKEGDITVVRPFSFVGESYLKRIYDTHCRNIMMMCGRQVHKTTTNGNVCHAYIALREHFRILYVTPTQQQTETFSRDRISGPIEISPVLQNISRGASTKDNVLYKKFTTKSDITLRYAYLTADRTRGIPADLLCLDEFQDILVDIIPVIEETLFSSPYKLKRYTGTPKSTENTIYHYWENYSTQNEWVVPCDRCGSNARGGAGRFWNIPGPNNLGNKGLVCERCGELINVAHEDAKWATMNASVRHRVKNPFEGFHISQLMCAWADWDDILDKVKRYSKQRLYNEVFGLGYDIGDRPLIKRDIKDNCHESLDITKPPKRSRGDVYFAGIDWGTGENKSFTVILIGKYVGSRFNIVYAYRFVGDETDPEVTMAKTVQILRRFKVNIIGADYGGGYDRNNALIKLFGRERVVLYQYANPGSKLQWQKKLGRFLVRRNDVLKDLLIFIKDRKHFRFPRWEQFRDPFGIDMTNVLSEYNESRKEEVLNKVPGTSDDSLHSLLYCFLASTMKFPRPDFMTPSLGD
jgi:hypothetical protein